MSDAAATATAEKAKASRLSCTECQRRKQKCSREWPCNHCRSRKVAPLCRFGPKKADSPKDDGEGRIKSQKRRRTDSDDGEDDNGHDRSRNPRGNEPDEVSLGALGYMPGHNHFGLDDQDQSNERLPTTATPARPAEMDYALTAVPPRFLTDSIVKNFIDNANYHYYATYPPTLLDEYTNWWTARSVGDDVSPVFTCLLLRILAMSAQYLNSIDLRTKIEFELSESAQTLTERFHNAAEKLSATITPGKGGLAGVQQLFLKAVWYKSEGLFVESWHALGAAIREAQENGMHQDRIPEGVNDFEIEMRRRLWVLLYVFDWQMAAWLHRPLIIDPTSCSFKLPNLRLEDPLNPDNGAPSPFAHMALQCRMCQVLSAALASRSDDEPLIDWHYKYIEIVQDFMDKFPAVYSVENPDTSWDSKYPYVPFQRHYLRTCTFMLQLDPLKPYLASPSSANAPSPDSKPTGASEGVQYLQSHAVTLLLNIMGSIRPWFNTIYPISAKFHFLTFCLFDTASVLCSAVLHDTHRTLPRRSELVDAIVDACDMLGKLGRNTKAGRISYSFVDKLVQRMDLSPAEKTLLHASGKRQRIDFSSPTSLASSSPRDHNGTAYASASHPDSSSASLNLGEPSSQPIPAETIALPLEIGVNVPIAAIPIPPPGWHYDPTLPPHPDLLRGPVSGYDIGGVPLDFGGLEHIWDWQSLNLDTGLDPLSVGVTYEPPAGGPNPNANLNDAYDPGRNRGL